MKVGITLNYTWEWLIDQPFFEWSDLKINDVLVQWYDGRFWMYNDKTDECDIKLSKRHNKKYQLIILHQFKEEMIADFEEFIHELVTNGEIQDTIKIL